MRDVEYVVFCGETAAFDVGCEWNGLVRRRGDGAYVVRFWDGVASGLGRCSRISLVIEEAGVCMDEVQPKVMRRMVTIATCIIVK